MPVFDSPWYQTTPEMAYGQSDADTSKVQQAAELEVEAHIGQRWISHGRPDALKLLTLQLLDGECFVGSISPVVLANLFV